MPAVYGSATIANATDAVSSAGVQPAIAQAALTAANTEMINGHIGSDQGVAVSTNNVAGNDIAIAGTPGRTNLGAAMTWCSCVAGAAAAATGTITGGVFVAGAGTAVAQSTIPANGFGWVKN